MKKKRNWLEKFQDFWWGELTESQRKCLWKVLTATRGPDREPRNADSIKWATTARIRYFLLGKEEVPGCYGFFSNRRVLSVAQGVIKNSVGLHFLDHVEMAVWNLRSVVKKSEMKDLLEIFQEEEKE